MANRVDSLIANLKRNWIRNVVDKQKRWWIEIVIPNDVCIEPSEEIKKVGSNDLYPHVLIQMTWDNVIKYGRYAVHKVRQYGTYEDDLLRKDLHEVRKAMASALQKLCKSECVWEVVGSDSTVSDVDINVFDDRIDQLKPLLQQQIHAWVGSNRVDILFDMNIYLSAFGRKETSRKKYKKVPYIERIPFSSTVNYVFVTPTFSEKYQESQLTWALLHLYEETMKTLNMQEIDAYIEKSKWKGTWNNAKELHTVMEKQRGNADKTITSLVKNAQTLWTTITTTKVQEDTVEQYMNILSMIQYYSRETYLTRGAYFHVVMEMSNNVKNLNLQPFEYMHSVIDNLAFVAELCKKDTLCPIQYTAIFAKISKYIYRICDALIKQGHRRHGTWDIVALRDSAASLNTMRKKTNVQQDEIDKKMEELHKLIGVLFHQEDAFTSADLATIFAQCVRIALNPFSHSTASATKTKLQCSASRTCQQRSKKTKRLLTAVLPTTHEVQT